MLLPQLRGGLVLATFIRTLYISKKMQDSYMKSYKIRPQVGHSIGYLCTMCIQGVFV